jgi:hypothetical protein
MIETTDLLGKWVSAALEPNTNPDGSVTYVKREFTFPGGNQWSLLFSGFGDAGGTFPLLTGRAVGTFDLGEPSVAVPGAREANFHFSKKYFTVFYQGIVDMFNGGSTGDWKVGVERDISETGCPFFPSVAQAAQEYDLLKFDAPNLYFGDRSQDLSIRANRPTKLIAYPVIQAP